VAEPTPAENEAAARAAFELIERLDGRGLVVTDDVLLARHVGREFGVAPSKVDPEYAAKRRGGG